MKICETRIVAVLLWPMKRKEPIRYHVTAWNELAGCREPISLPYTLVSAKKIALRYIYNQGDDSPFIDIRVERYNEPRQLFLDL
jgi:hypothetical protein